MQATITDADIDIILAAGEQRTQEFAAKLQQLGSDSLQNFTFDTASAPRSFFFIFYLLFLNPLVNSPPIWHACRPCRLCYQHA